MRHNQDGRMHCIGLLLTLAASSSGQVPQTQPACPGIPRVKLTSNQTISGIGAGQGAVMHEGFVYLYGDRDTGVVREYRVNTEPKIELNWTNREFLLTRNGDDLASHPTGLTFHEQLPTFLGNTVRGKGTIFSIDWDRLKMDGNLNHAVKACIEDDLAINGTRPEYVFRAGKWLVATADYGGERNEIRYYDPKRLAQAKRTSEPGVLVDRQACGAWVQGLSWWREPNILVMVQNQREGRGWRLTFLLSIEPCTKTIPVVQDDFEIRGELEGFCMLGGNRCLLLQASRQGNVWFGTVDRASAPASQPTP